MDLLDLMRRAPGAGPALDALAEEPAVHVVGGAVRDALLGRVPRELDFVVEGDAAPVARRAARRLGGEVLVHDRFGTATVRARGSVFDIVSARSETYERPGALPVVRTGATLADDLARRDFTVNAIAMHLAGGELAERPGAIADLEARRLRVLHGRSFLDDPTRMVRLARYAARLGFAVEPGTDALAAAAVSGGAVETVSGGRLGSELRLLLGEPQPAALLALERHGLGAAVVHRAFTVSAELVDATLALCPDDARPDLAALAACLVGAGRDELSAALERLEFEANARDLTSVAASGAPDLRATLEGVRPQNQSGQGSDPSGVAVGLWRVLRRAPPEAVAVAGALGRGGPAEARARWWMQDLRHRTLAIDGHDLVAAGLSGPAVGDALDAAHAAMLAGEAPGREAQLAAALGRR